MLRWHNPETVDLSLCTDMQQLHSACTKLETDAKKADEVIDNLKKNIDRPKQNFFLKIKKKGFILF